VPCRQVGVELVKQGITGIRGCAARLLGLDGRLSAGFWAVYPEETGPEVLRQQLDAAGGNVAGYGHAE
jgi:hypothetical protein